MGKADHYEAGQWNAICDRCGFKFKAKTLRKEWTGLMVCNGPGSNDCWEARNVQERVRGKADKQAPKWVRPEPQDVFLGTNEVTPDDL